MISLSAFSAEQIYISFENKEIKQGSIENAVVEINIQAAQNPGLKQIKNLNLAETFYIYNAKPFFRKEGEGTLKAEAKVVLLKVPESKPISHSLNNSAITISWNEVRFIPTKEEKSLIFGTFEIPARLKFVQWLIALVILGLIGVGIFVFYKKQNKSREKKRLKAELKDYVISGRDYTDVVQIWQKKQQILKEFPKLDDAFKNLEAVLFKYQFKPHQADSEKEEVMRAYRTFINTAQGGFDGI